MDSTIFCTSFYTLLKICNHINSRVTLGVNINMVRVIVNPNANH